MIIDALELADTQQIDLPYQEARIQIANKVALETYLRALNTVITEPTTILVYTALDAKNLGSLFGGGAIKPIEVVTNGLLTESKHFGTHDAIPGASWTGWTASERWERAPFGFFINTVLKAEEVKNVARSAEATKVAIFARSYHQTNGLQNQKPAVYPYK